MGKRARQSVGDEQSGPAAKRQKASRTAKGGYDAEKAVIESINAQDNLGQAWATRIFGTTVGGTVTAAPGVHGSKCDVIIKLSTAGRVVKRGIQVKKYAKLPGYNSVGRDTLAQYQAALQIPHDVASLLGFFCGEKSPADYDSAITPRDRKNRRLFLGELKDADREKIRLYFARNPAAIVKRVLLGNSAVAPEWMLIVRQVKSTPEYRLVAMETAIAFFATGPVQMTSGPGGNLAIGNLTMQRKGGDSGDPRPNDLQFKVRLEDFWTKLNSSQ